MSAAETVYPLNVLAFVVTLMVPDGLGNMAPLTEGAATCFLATSEDPSAIAADPALVGTMTYLGADGRWSVRFEYADLQPATLATHFASTQPYCIMQVVGALRVSLPLNYAPTKRVTLT